MGMVTGYSTEADGSPTLRQQNLHPPWHTYREVDGVAEPFGDSRTVLVVGEDGRQHAAGPEEAVM